MLFNSLYFLIFFPLVVGIYFLLPYRVRWIWLLLASCYFYMAFIPVYIIVLFLLIIIDYFAAILIEKAQGRMRKFYLCLSIFSTCIVLFMFKYFNFFNANLSQLAQFIGWNYPIENLKLILPIGLSFHTFQSLSYVVEVYRKNFPVQKHLGVYAVYVMFFPQLVAGPIERPYNLIPQFFKKYDFDYERVTNGLKLMAWGFLKKLVVADRLAIFVNYVYGDVHDLTGAPLVLATYFFAFQIYCDFSGYSDIAIGSAKVLGFNLMENFKQPYLARSIREFWQRWHISLTSWFRDYLYIPLGGNRVNSIRFYFNVIIVFLVSGLWHGANWTFAVWGGLHGFYYLMAVWTRGLREKMASFFLLDQFPAFCKAIRIFIIFNLVAFAWIFFRARSFSDAWYIVTHLFVNFSGDWAAGPSGRRGLLLSALGLALIIGGDIFQSRVNVRDWLARRSVLVRWSAYYGLILSIIILGVFERSPFIYFQF